jgi:hypothetical protein
MNKLSEINSFPLMRNYHSQEENFLTQKQEIYQQNATSKVSENVNKQEYSLSSNNISFVKAAIINNPVAIAFANLNPNDLREVALFAVQKNGISYFCLNEELQKDLEIRKIAEEKMPKEYVSDQKNGKIFCSAFPSQVFDALKIYGNKKVVTTKNDESSIFIRDSHVTLFEDKGHLIPYSFSETDELLISRILSASLPFSGDIVLNNEKGLCGKGFHRNNTSQAMVLAYKEGNSFKRAMSCIEGGNCFLLINSKGEKRALIGELSLTLSMIALERQGYFKDISVKEIENPSQDALRIARNLAFYYEKVNPADLMLLEKRAAFKNDSEIKNFKESIGFIEDIEYQTLLGEPLSLEDCIRFHEEGKKIDAKINSTKNVIASELGLSSNQLAFLPQTQFHIDTEMTVTPDKKVILHDDRKTIRFLEKEMKEICLENKELELYKIYLERALKRAEIFHETRERQKEILRENGIEFSILPAILENGTQSILNYCNGIFIKTPKNCDAEFKDKKFVYFTTGPSSTEEEIFHRRFSEIFQKKFPKYGFYGVKNISHLIASSHGGVHCLTFENRLSFSNSEKMISRHNIKKDYKENSLHLLVKQNDIQALSHLLETNIELNSQDDLGNTPLHIAVKLGRINVIELLLKNGAYVLLNNKDSQTALDIATKLGRKDIIDLLDYHNRFQLLGVPGVSSKGRSIMLNNINKISDLDIKLKNLKQAILEMRWNDPLFDITNKKLVTLTQEDLFEFRWISLHGLANRVLSTEEYAMIQEYLDIRCQYPKELIGILKIYDEEGSINADALKILQACLCYATPAREESDFQNNLSIEELEVYIQVIKYQLDPHLQIIFISPSDSENSFIPSSLILSHFMARNIIKSVFLHEQTLKSFV